MTGFERVRAALAPLNIPVTAFVGDAGAPVYAVVYEMLEQPELRADDRELLTGWYAQIDFISKRDVEAQVARATELLDDAGFIRRSQAREYEPQSGTFRTMLRVFYLGEYGG